MTIKELAKEQSKMSDNELAEKVDKIISELSRTGGRSFKMSVPVDINDTDMLLSEILRRFKYIISKPITKENLKKALEEAASWKVQMTENEETKTVLSQAKKAVLERILNKYK